MWNAVAAYVDEITGIIVGTPDPRNTLEWLKCMVHSLAGVVDKGFHRRLQISGMCAFKKELMNPTGHESRQVVTDDSARTTRYSLR